MKTLFWRLNGKLGLRITTHSNPVNITVPPEIWERIQATPGATWTDGKDWYVGPGSNKINTMLQGMLTDVKMTYTLLLGYGAEITAQSVRDVYKDMTAGKYEFTAQGLAKCMKERSVKRVRMNTVPLLYWHLENGIRNTDSTKGQRKILIRNVERFLSETGLGDLPAERFTVPIMNRFLDYMRRRGLKDSYINEHISYIKSAVDAGHGRDYVAENQLASYDFHFIRDEHTNFLNPEQLQWLIETDFTLPVPPAEGAVLPKKNLYPGPWYGEKMQQTVDLFIFCTQTAFHYCDREELTEAHFKTMWETDWLIKTRRKTKRFNAQAIVKLSPQAKEILAKYGGVEKLPKMDYWVNMGYLYRLGKLMGLPFKLATGHARNTFAHLALNEWGWDIESVATFMGLKSIETIKKYAYVRIERLHKKIRFAGETA